jgi:hypothetical protein
MLSDRHHQALYMHRHEYLSRHLKKVFAFGHVQRNLLFVALQPMLFAWKPTAARTTMYTRANTAACVWHKLLPRDAVA